MGTSQSRPEGGGGNPTIDRLKRYSRADLKSPLKSAFGRQHAASPKASGASTGEHGKKHEGTGSTPASDYETPIYETGQRKAPAVVSWNMFWWLC